MAKKKATTKPKVTTPKIKPLEQLGTDLAADLKKIERELAERARDFAPLLFQWVALQNGMKAIGQPTEREIGGMLSGLPLDPKAVGIALVGKACDLYRAALK